MKLTKKQTLFLEAFKKHATNATKACEAVGIARQTYYDWQLTNLTFKEECEAIHESMIDFAESMLYKNMKNGKESSVLFFLKTRGRKRGYVEKQELELTGDIRTDNKWTIEFIEAKNEQSSDTEQTK